jgi:hypothetical protein
VLGLGHEQHCAVSFAGSHGLCWCFVQATSTLKRAALAFCEVLKRAECWSCSV